MCGLILTITPLLAPHDQLTMNSLLICLQVSNYHLLPPAEISSEIN